KSKCGAFDVTQYSWHWGMRRTTTQVCMIYLQAVADGERCLAYQGLLWSKDGLSVIQLVEDDFVECPCVLNSGLKGPICPMSMQLALTTLHFHVRCMR